MMRALQRFFFEPQPVYPLVVCRIVLGLALLYLYAMRGLDFRELLGAQGLSHYMGHESALVPAAATPWLYGLLMVAAAAFTLGMWTPLAGLVLAGCHVYFNTLVPLEWGWRNIVHALVVYVALSGAGTYCGLDALRARRAGALPVTHVPGWPLRLVQLHVTAIYIAASYHRLDDPGWLEGQMVFEALAMSLWTRFPGVDFSGPTLLLEIGSWWAFVLELAAPIALWITRYRVRTVMVVNLLAMHALLGLTSMLGIWQPMMIGALACFAPPAWSRAVLTRLAAWAQPSDRRAREARPDRRTPDTVATSDR